MAHFGAPRRLSPTLYEVLGVPPSAASEQVRAEWRARCLALHPDKHVHASEPAAAAASAAFAAAREAYNVLGDTAQRRVYDMWLASGRVGDFETWRRGRGCVHFVVGGRRGTAALEDATAVVEDSGAVGPDLAPVKYAPPMGLAAWRAGHDGAGRTRRAFRAAP